MMFILRTSYSILSYSVVLTHTQSHEPLRIGSRSIQGSFSTWDLTGAVIQVPNRGQGDGNQMMRTVPWRWVQNGEFAGKYGTPAVISWVIIPA